MKIQKCSEFINEAVVSKVLDKVIDHSGKLHDIKGYITPNGMIKDINDVEYAAGIDKNGELVTFLDTDENTGIFTDKKLFKWNTKDNYSELLSKLATGWVNVKLDMEVTKKVRRLATNIINDISIEAFDKKLKLLSNPALLKDTTLNNTDRFLITQSIQSQMSAIMLLRYILEIKDHFNPSQAGFLFESFLGGLLPGKVPDDNSYCDIISDQGTTYQVKFMSSLNVSGSNYIIEVDIEPNDNGDACDQFIIALKEHNKISIWRLHNNDNGNTRHYIGTYMTSSGLSTYRLKTLPATAILDLSKIDDEIDKISKNLRAVVTSLWTEISELQYNIETIITGVDKQNNIIDRNKYNLAYREATDNLKNLEVQLTTLKKEMRPNIG